MGQRNRSMAAAKPSAPALPPLSRSPQAPGTPAPVQAPVPPEAQERLSRNCTIAFRGFSGKYQVSGANLVFDSGEAGVQRLPVQLQLRAAQVYDAQLRIHPAAGASGEARSGGLNQAHHPHQFPAGKPAGQLLHLLVGGHTGEHTNPSWGAVFRII